MSAPTHPIDAAGGAAAEPLLDEMLDWSRTLAWSDVSEANRRALKLELLDYLGCIVAGRASIGMPVWLQVLLDQGGAAEATVAGGGKVPAQTAALCNGYFGHVLEFDDTHEASQLHAASATVPAVLAGAERQGRVSGAAFCEAALLAIELVCRMGQMSRLNLAQSGWIFGTLFGHFGAALGAGRIAGLGTEALRDAIGIAYTLDCGNHQSTREGAPTKHVQPGFAAAHGVQASLMAGAGLRGIRQPISGEDGLARVYMRGGFDTAGWGHRAGPGHHALEIGRLSFKPFPTCRFTHPAITAALDLREQHALTAGRVRKVEASLSVQSCDVVGRATPQRLAPHTRNDAQFSVQWCIAVALLHGHCGIEHLSLEVPPRPELAALIARIACVADPQADNRGAGTARIRVWTDEGVHEAEVRISKGHPDNPLAEAELRSKFARNLALAGVGADEADCVASSIMTLDELPDVVPMLATTLALVRGR